MRKQIAGRLLVIRAQSVFLFCLLCAGLALTAGNLDPALAQLSGERDKQDVNALNQSIGLFQAAATQSKAPDAQYRAALAYSYAAEVAMELHDKKKSAGFAENGMTYAKKAVDEKANDAEYHRLLGQLCGQVIPADPIFGALKYGQCARDELNKAIELDGQLALAYVGRGVGNYYLPASMGGGPDVAMKDFDKALSIDSRLADAYLWKGLALHKENRQSEAREALQRCLAIDPNRVWAKQELDKLPGH